jgi:hypothetical protein
MKTDLQMAFNIIVGENGDAFQYSETARLIKELCGEIKDQFGSLQKTAMCKSNKNYVN